MFRGLALLVFLVFIAGMLFVGQSIYLNDIETGNTTNIYNLTGSIQTPENSCEIMHNQTISIPEIKINRIENIVCAFIDFGVTAGMEVVKFGVEFGYENPQYNYEFFLKIFKLYIYAIILVIVIPIIIPLLALIYLLGVGITKAIKYISRKVKKAKFVHIQKEWLDDGEKK